MMIESPEDEELKDLDLAGIISFDGTYFIFSVSFNSLLLNGLIMPT